MKWLCEYIKQCFCIHSFEYTETKVENKFDGATEKFGTKGSLMCKKCGYHKNFWKHLSNKYE